MGSHAITYAVVALAIAAVGLIAGFFWGRSNVRAQIEQAVGKEHVALDAREFAMRTQLEDAIAENARLRPLAEELARVQKRLEQDQSRFEGTRPDSTTSLGTAVPEPSGPDQSVPETLASADHAIQKLMQSLEAFNAPHPDNAAIATVKSGPASSPSDVANVPAQPPPHAAQEPIVLPQFAPAPEAGESGLGAPSAAAAKPPAHSDPASNPAPQDLAPGVAPATPSSPARKPNPPTGVRSGQTVDEWQEFARQLEALTGKKK